MIPDLATWQTAADTTRRIGHAVEFHPSIGSTNDRAREALTEPGGDGLAVVADLQTAGRGRQGRTWVSPAGSNLAVSVAFRPHLPAARAGLLGLAVAAAALEACREQVPGSSLGLRWPNDIVSGDGLKIAGLLIETAVAGDTLAEAVAGIGINVNWHRADMPDEIRERATSLCDLAGRELDRVALLRALLARLDGELAELEAGGSPATRIRPASVLDGRWVTVDLGATRVEGRVLGIADDGSLEVEHDAQRSALAVGEVVAVRDLPLGATA